MKTIRNSRTRQKIWLTGLVLVLASQVNWYSLEQGERQDLASLNAGPFRAGIHTNDAQVLNKKDDLNKTNKKLEQKAYYLIKENVTEWNLTFSDKIDKRGLMEDREAIHFQVTDGYRTNCKPNNSTGVDFSRLLGTTPTGSKCGLNLADPSKLEDTLKDAKFYHGELDLDSDLAKGLVEQGIATLEAECSECGRSKVTIEMSSSQELEKINDILGSAIVAQAEKIKKRRQKILDKELEFKTLVKNYQKCSQDLNIDLDEESDISSNDLLTLDTKKFDPAEDEDDFATLEYIVKKAGMLKNKGATSDFGSMATSLTGSKKLECYADRYKYWAGHDTEKAEKFYFDNIQTGLEQQMTVQPKLTEEYLNRLISIAGESDDVISANSGLQQSYASLRMMDFREQFREQTFGAASVLKNVGTNGVKRMNTLMTLNDINTNFNNFNSQLQALYSSGSSYYSNLVGQMGRYQAAVGVPMDQTYCLGQMGIPMFAYMSSVNCSQILDGNTSYDGIITALNTQLNYTGIGASLSEQQRISREALLGNLGGLGANSIYNNIVFKPSTLSTATTSQPSNVSALTATVTGSQVNPTAVANRRRTNGNTLTFTPSSGRVTGASTTGTSHPRLN